MICPPHAPAPAVENWKARHRDPRNLVLHLIGIPPTVIAVLLLPVALGALSPAIFVFSLALFVGGYLIQFLGHALDRTMPGELTGLRKLIVKETGDRRQETGEEGRPSEAIRATATPLRD
jgi:uncharacterized membrane protein YGL010W